MSKAIETLSGEDATAFAAAIKPYVLDFLPPLQPSFSGDGELTIYADQAMTLTQVATTGTGTLAFTKALSATPTVFEAAASPFVLAAGDRLKVTASAVDTFVAVSLKRTG